MAILAKKTPAEHVLLQPSGARQLEAQTSTSRSRVMLVMCLSIMHKKKKTLNSFSYVKIDW